MDEDIRKANESFHEAVIWLLHVLNEAFPDDESMLPEIKDAMAGVSLRGAYLSFLELMKQLKESEDLDDD